jgi:hypothetical protein
VFSDINPHLNIAEGEAPEARLVMVLPSSKCCPAFINQAVMYLAAGHDAIAERASVLEALIPLGRIGGTPSQAAYAERLLAGS